MPEGRAVSSGCIRRRPSRAGSACGGAVVLEGDVCRSWCVLEKMGRVGRRSLASALLLAGVLLCALLSGVAAAQAAASEIRREGVRLPILGPDREPIDLLQLRPEEVERRLQARERDPMRLPDGVTPATALAAAELADDPAMTERRAAEAVAVERIWLPASRRGEGTILAEVALENHSAQPHRLVSVYTEAAEDAILHVSHWRGGVRYAQRLEALHLPPEERVELRPGGPQLLLVDLRRPLNRGEAISMTLHFADGSRKTIEAPIDIADAP